MALKSISVLKEHQEAKTIFCARCSTPTLRPNVSHNTHIIRVHASPFFFTEATASLLGSIFFRELHLLGFDLGIVLVLEDFLLCKLLCVAFLWVRGRDDSSSQWRAVQCNFGAVGHACLSSVFAHCAETWPDWNLHLLSPHEAVCLTYTLRILSWKSNN